MFKKILKAIFRDVVGEKAERRAIQVVKHMKESKIKEVCHVLGGNIIVQLEDGSRYLLEPRAMRKPNEMNWNSLSE